MKTTKGRKIQKSTEQFSKKIEKKLTKNAKKKKDKIKVSAENLLANAKKKLNKIKKQSSKTLVKAKDKVWATEEEILDYVKANPVKSASALALTALIAGFISRYRKK